MHAYERRTANMKYSLTIEYRALRRTPTTRLGLRPIATFIANAGPQARRGDHFAPWGRALSLPYMSGQWTSQLDCGV